MIQISCLIIQEGDYFFRIFICQNILYKIYILLSKHVLKYCYINKSYISILYRRSRFTKAAFSETEQQLNGRKKRSTSHKLKGIAYIINLSSKTVTHKE